MRHYVRDSFLYLRNHDFEAGLMEALKDVVEGGKDGGGSGPLSKGDVRVPDGVRYHVLDVWVDGLEAVVMGDEGKKRKDVVGSLMEPVRGLEKGGRTKVVRRRAREVLEDERLGVWLGNGAGKEKMETEAEERDDEEEEEKEWNGFED
ncbi:MAG: hypothetical protein Q9219_006899 [cf. Caloplaca sp. 3 TL-2023]